MAEGALFYLIIRVMGEVHNLLNQNLETWSIEDGLNKLRETVSKIRETVSKIQETDSIIKAIWHAEAKQHIWKEKKLWLKRREDAMCDADDLDEIFLEDLIRDVMTLDKLCIDLNRYFFFFFYCYFYFIKKNFNSQSQLII